MCLPKKLKAFSSASIKDNMLILNSQSKFKASRSEIRVMFDKISSVSLSVAFGRTSFLLLVFGLLIAAVGVVLAVVVPDLYYVTIALAAIGLLLVALAFVFRVHTIVVDCSGDICSVCLGRKQTDDVYNHIIAVLVQMHANDLRR